MATRLTGLDATFLYVETDAMPMHVAMCAVLDPSTIPGGYSFDKMRTHIAERVPLVKELTRTVVEVPFRVDHPVWVDDPTFKIEHHVHRTVLDPPGDEHQLAAFVAELAERRLDRRRPLWEFWIVEGLEGGRLALAGKIHHCALDGGAAADLMPAFFGIEPDPEPIPPPEREPEPRPDDLTMLTDAVVARTRRLAGALGTLPQVGRAFRGVRDHRNGSDSAGGTPLTCPTTPFNGAITSKRAIAFGRLPLADVKAVGRAVGATVNDVLLATCAEAFRSYLLSVDALPDKPLVIAVPVGVRREEEKGGTGNKVSIMFVHLHTEIDDPAECLAATVRDAAAAKAEHAIVGGETIERVLDLADPLVIPFGLNVYSRAGLADRHRPAINATVSNVVGPPFPIYLGGARAERLYPMGPVIEGAGLNLTVMSYDGHVDIGLLAAAVLVPDPWVVTARLPDALQLLADALGADLAGS
ncbi:MAG TPA: wax ester/triacylglycerol synthase family O-acyltransferase [Acidimicrobiales bacterium]